MKDIGYALDPADESDSWGQAAEVCLVPAGCASAEDYRSFAAAQRSAKGTAGLGQGPRGNGTTVDDGKVGVLCPGGSAQAQAVQKFGYLLGLVLVDLAADDLNLVCFYVGHGS